jgi:hypothetical protein
LTLPDHFPETCNYEHAASATGVVHHHGGTMFELRVSRSLNREGVARNAA